MALTSSVICLISFLIIFPLMLISYPEDYEIPKNLVDDFCLKNEQPWPNGSTFGQRHILPTPFTIRVPDKCDSLNGKAYNNLKTNIKTSTIKMMNFYDTDSSCILMGGFELDNIGEKYSNSPRFCSPMTPQENLQISMVLGDPEPRFSPFSDYLKGQALESSRGETSQELSYEMPCKTDQFEMEQQNQKQKEDKHLPFYKGHLQFLTKKKTPIFLLSRKINKTKKTNIHRQSYYGELDKKMPNKRKGESKKLDQRLQQKFEKLSAEEQKSQEVTLEAIRFLGSSEDSEAQRILHQYESKVSKYSLLTDFLDSFVNSA